MCSPFCGVCEAEGFLCWRAGACPCLVVYSFTLLLTPIPSQHFTSLHFAPSYPIRSLHSTSLASPYLFGFGVHRPHNKKTLHITSLHPILSYPILGYRIPLLHIASLHPILFHPILSLHITSLHFTSLLVTFIPSLCS